MPEWLAWTVFCAGLFNCAVSLWVCRLSENFVNDARRYLEKSKEIEDRILNK